MACVLAFINCIIAGSPDISTRVKLRNELIGELLGKGWGKTVKTGGCGFTTAVLSHRGITVGVACNLNLVSMAVFST